MKVEQYRQLTAELVQRAQRDDDVLGLVALGSMADSSRVDRWSDHDFFWVVRPGRQEHYRQNVDWLPERDEIVLSVRETAHGLKVLYTSGHLLEFAVFDPDEIHLARANDYAVLVDGGGIAEAMTAIVARSAPEPVDPGHELGMVISQLLVGTGRHARGEKLSGQAFVKSQALQHLLRLFGAVLAAGQGSDRPGHEPVVELDNLDPLRRFEQVHPELGAAIGEALACETPRCAWLFAEIIDRVLRDRVTPFPFAALKTLREHLRRVDSTLGSATPSRPTPHDLERLPQESAHPGSGGEGR